MPLNCRDFTVSQRSRTSSESSPEGQGGQPNVTYIFLPDYEVASIKKKTLFFSFF